MTPNRSIINYLLLSLNILLLFFLTFEEYVILPKWMTPLGRMHPMILHLPIGFTVILGIFLFSKNKIEKKSFEVIKSNLLALTALTAGIVALMGFFLSKEGGYDERLIQFHKFSGVAVSLFAWLIVFLEERRIVKPFLDYTLLVIMAFAGHFGAGITHGENYLFEAWQETSSTPKFSEKDPIYKAVIFPIFEAKCLACHNDEKTKGMLNMSSIEKILKGGKNGMIWKAGDALNSHIIQRINLPLDHKEHMPPKGKAQLTINEIALLNAWINEGADFEKSVINYGENSDVKKTASVFMEKELKSNNVKIYTFSALSETELEKLNTPFCSVSPIASGSPALKVDFFVSKKFDRKSLENLTKASEQLVSLNLSNMPIIDTDLAIISNFQNLEKLNLNNTDIAGNTLEALNKCKNLVSISLAGTRISKTNLRKILDLPNLKEVFLWNTSLNQPSIVDLKKKYLKIRFDVGRLDLSNEMLQLNPPILVNENFIIKSNTPISLRHTLQQVKIRYTLDGSEPDSTSSDIYLKPIYLNKSSVLKAIATKDNWLASKKVEFNFFKSGIIPDSLILADPPETKFSGKGASTLIDLKKGSVLNVFDKEWLGFSQKDFVGYFLFTNPKTINSLTISYLRKMGSSIFPPQSVTVYAGNNRNSLTQVSNIILEQPKEMMESANFGLDIPITKGSCRIIKVVIKPVSRLPAWHSEKGKKGRILIDEIFFN